MLKSLSTTLLLTASLAAQQSSKPQVRVTMLNVCTPSPDEQKELSAALARIPANPKWGTDFEVARGRSSTTGEPGLVQPGIPAQMEVTATVSDWARIRREFPPESSFVNAQYSFSLDPKTMTETLVFRVRDPKDLMQISIQDTMSAVVRPAAALATDTPVSRIRLERLGKSSVVLARCSAADQSSGSADQTSRTGAPRAVDQSAYEPLFRTASSIMTNYRRLLRVRSTIPAELSRLSSESSPRAPSTKSHPKHTSNPTQH